MLTQTHTHWRHTIAKTRAEFSLKVSRKCFVQNYCFQKSAWLVFTSSLPDEWTQGFPMKAFCENFTVTTYYTEDTTALYILMVYSFDWRRLQYQHETLSSKYVFFSFLFFFFFSKTFKYYNTDSLSSLYEQVLLTKTTTYLYILVTSMLSVDNMIAYLTN